MTQQQSNYITAPGDYLITITWAQLTTVGQNQTPWGDGILGITMLCAAWAVIYWLGWLLMP